MEDPREGKVVSKFEIILDPHRRLLTVTLRGFWDVQTYCDYDAEVTAQLRRLNQLKAAKACLVDAREFSIQSKEVADLMVEGVAKRLSFYPERTARVVSCAISHSQAARMGKSSDQRVYDSVDEALDWLLDRRSAAA